MITVETRVCSDKEGREYLSMTPVFKPSHCATGELRFSCWHAWLDEPDTIKPQREAAIDNARKCLKKIAMGE